MKELDDGGDGGRPYNQHRADRGEEGNDTASRVGGLRHIYRKLHRHHRHRHRCRRSDSPNLSIIDRSYTDATRPYATYTLDGIFALTLRRASCAYPRRDQSDNLIVSSTTVRCRGRARPVARCRVVSRRLALNPFAGAPASPTAEGARFLSGRHARNRGIGIIII